MNNLTSPVLSQASLQVLSALLRLSRRREAATLEKLHVRCDLEAAALQSTLSMLAQMDLIVATGAGPARLTLPGFALAVMFTSKRAARAKGTSTRRAAA